MARVNYSATINEIKGSIGGTTFQRNKSGTIAKLKSINQFNPSLNQLVSRGSFNSIVKAWQSISFAAKLLWNAFAVSYSKFNYWGEEKTLSGFNWFCSININRSLTGQSQLSQPPSYITPIQSPQFLAFPYSSNLSIIFDYFAEIDNYYIFVYATPPIRGTNLQSRRSLRLIDVLSPDNLFYYNLTTAWESYFNIVWPSASNSEDYNILIACSLIHKVTGIAGAFYLDNKSLDLSSDPQTLGNVITDLGQQFSESQIRVLCYIGNGICLAGTQATGLILRSTDYGANWSSLGQQFAQTAINSMCYCGGGIALAGTATGGLILRSTDYGATWSSLGNMFSESLVNSMCYCGNGIALAGTGNNGLILRSTDYGANWSSLGTMFSQTLINCLVYLGNGIVLAGTQTGGLILRSTDYGANWSSLGQQFSQGFIKALCYLGNGVCLAGTQTGGLILRSTDYGATWSNLGQQFSEGAIISFTYFGFGVVFAGTATSGYILRSLDFGATWSNLGAQGAETYILSATAAWNVQALFGSYANGHIFTTSY